MSILDNLKKIIRPGDESEAEFEKVLLDSVAEHAAISSGYYDIKLNNIPTYINTVKQWNDKKRIAFVLHSVREICKYEKGRKVWYSDNPEDHKYSISKVYLQQLFKTTLIMDETDIEVLYKAFSKTERRNWALFSDWPVSSMILQIERQYKEKKLSPKIIETLEQMKAELEGISNTYYEKERLKLIERIKSILHRNDSDNSAIKPVLLLGDDELSEYINPTIEAMPDDERMVWYHLVSMAQKASGSKPKKKYLDEAKKLISQIGADKFRKVTHDWFRYIIDLKEKITEHTQTYNGTTYTYLQSEFLSAINTETIKGFVWMNSLYYDNQTIQTLSKLADRCYRKIPQKGPAAAAIGNACLFSLYQSKGLDGIGQLTRLRLKIKQNNTVALIEKYIEEAAAKMGVSRDEIEDLAVDDFKLADGIREYKIDTFNCRIELCGIGRSVIRWFREDGSEQKTVPTVVKEKYSATLKKIKDTQKQIDQTTSAQRDRMDRMLRSDRVMSVSYFKERYMAHNLLSYIARRIIYNLISSNGKIQAIHIDGVWQDYSGKSFDLDQYESVSLWHPVTSDTSTVKQWRDFLMDKRIVQPFKQAFREIYLITEAEFTTRTYSNRMASHILKQHQYVTLAKGRNWNAKLLGAWDDGYDYMPSLELPEYKLRAEYWINALDAENGFNETGIWNYVTTDQIRFVNTGTNEAVELIEVPPIPFSETLRDVDLFVGVASVGNDPNWSDSGGLPAYREYWQSYSFGDLSEIAKNRKEILSSLIPRLKIANVTAIEDKFVVVKGKLRTYKIHIGSTNILMSPNDQYLCIVPNNSKKETNEKLFLPFEGDNGLSVILSKAFLLADDDKITDISITSQINRK